MNTVFNVIKLKYTFKVKFYLPIIPNETALIKNLVNATHTQKMMFSKQAQTKLQKKKCQNMIKSRISFGQSKVTSTQKNDYNWIKFQKKEI